MELVVEADDRRWDTLLEAAPHDVFHTAGFHRFAADAEGGRARMIVLGDADRGIAWPYVQRPVSRVPGLESVDALDVGATLGYTGPVTWGLEAGDPWLASAWDTIRRVWHRDGVVSVFTRFHPIVDNAAIARGFGSAQSEPSVVPAGLMVSVDCTSDDAVASTLLPRVLRQEITAARRAGLVTREDAAWRSVNMFVALYRATMARNHASDGSDISASDVMRLRDELGSNLHLMTTTLDSSIVAAGLFSEYRGIVQALLVGIDHARRRWSPLKVMLDDVRAWAHRRGDRVLHLGGGRGGRLDSLYEFKSRFSERRHRAHVGRWVIDPVAYAELTRARERNLRTTGRAVATSDWFPAYRAPLAPRPRVGISVAQPSPRVGRIVALPVAGETRPASSRGGGASSPD
jgi:Acetyltransferase (GNAT) domain